MTQTTGVRKHHTPSPECQAPGVAFVLGVSAIIDDPKAPTPYGEFYKACDKRIYELGYEPKQLFENEMLCVLMCCCSKFPAQGSKINVYQGCVKDILDEANQVKAKVSRLPTTRFLAEPSINMDLGEMGRGRMNPGGPKKQPGQELKRPDIGILKHVPVSPPAGLGTIAMKDYERFVEMKFETEPQDIKSHQKQINMYLSWGKGITFMTPAYGANFISINGLSTWHCGCGDKNPEKLLQPGVAYAPEEEYERKRAQFSKVLDAALLIIPGRALVRGLKWLGTLGKVLLPLGA